MSDKTTAALAEELEKRAPAEAETITAEPQAQTEELAIITINEVDDLMLPGDTEAEDLPAPCFRIGDDDVANWAVKKIKVEKDELMRLTELAGREISRINEQVERAKRRYQQNTDFLTSCLANYFQQVPHVISKGKTKATYRLLSGTLTMKFGKPDFKRDDEKLVSWLKDNGYKDMVKTKEEPMWGDLKKKLAATGEIVTFAETGEILEGVTAVQLPDTFVVE